MLLQFLDGCRKDFLLKHASLPTLPKPMIGLDEVIANVKEKIVNNHMLAVVGMGFGTRKKQKRSFSMRRSLQIFEPFGCPKI
ncbi:unnamed protein product [Sphagnum compactum]